MKARSFTWIALLLASVTILLVALFLRDHDTPASKKPATPAGKAAKTVASSDSRLSEPNALRVDTTNNVLEVRGAGYNWGTAVKAVYAGAKITPDGKTRLDVTALEKSFKGYASPVDLSNSSEPSRMRAEYMASTLTAALDLNTSHQPALTFS